MSEHGFSLTRIFLYIEQYMDFLYYNPCFPYRGKYDQRKPVFWHILRINGFVANKNVSKSSLQAILTKKINK